MSVTVSWTLIGGDSADFYLINITCTNAPQLPHGGFVNTTNASVTQHEFSGFVSGYDYNIVVRAVTANCGGLVGRESEPLRITPRGSIKNINWTTAQQQRLNIILLLVSLVPSLSCGEGEKVAWYILFVQAKPYQDLLELP